MNLYQQFIAKSRYARYIDDKQRREHWSETVKRYFDFMEEHLRENNNYILTQEFRHELEQSVLNLEVMPSMRLLMTAGEAVKKSHVSAYNCSFIAIDDIKAFDELMYVLMCGTGVGFSVEAVHVGKLPEIPDRLFKSGTVIMVKDSREGWSKALRQLIALLYAGEIPSWDVSKVRPAGSRLKVFGGRSSGPGPLQDLFLFIIEQFKRASGRRLNSLECHDICCKIAEVVICGGVRRCLDEDTYILTSEGSRSIKDINVGDNVKSSYGQYKKVLAKKFVGNQQTLNIDTIIGTVKSTAEHRWAVYDDPSNESFIFKEAKHLDKNDRLVFVKTSRSSETSLPKLLDDYKPNRNFSKKKVLNLEKIQDSDWAWFLGFLHGDGSVHSNLCCVSFTLAGDMPATLDKILSFGKIFDVKSNGTYGTTDAMKRIRFSSRHLANYLSKYKQANAPISIPEEILHGSDCQKYSYLAGLFDADGTAKNKNKTGKVLEVITSKYKSFILSVRNMLLDLGYPCRVTKKFKGSYEGYRLVIVGSSFKDFFAEKIKNFSEKINNDYSWTPLKKFNDGISFNKASAKKIGINSANGYSVAFNSISLEKHIPIKIKSISDGDIRPCYDLQVADTECFCAEGLLTHNSALISLSDLEDSRIATCKHGEWWIVNPQRSLANNSAVYNEKPDITKFTEEWINLIRSGCGERGLFSRYAIKKKLSSSRRKYRDHIGGNPCLEIYLNKFQFCNLTSVVVRPEDTEETLLAKFKKASILGTFQSSLTFFPYLRKEWKKITEEERLLGVSITGLMDNSLLNNLHDELLPLRLESFKTVVIETNKTYADVLNIPHSVATTAIKPEGSVSQLVNASSGMHAQHSRFYIRTVRNDNKDPITEFLKSSGVQWEPCVVRPESTTVFFFPKKAPEGAILREDLSATEHLELWNIYNKYYCEHNPSVTVSVKDAEWLEVGAWVYKHFDEVTGVSFLPYDGGSYKQAPYQEITEEQYEELLAKTPKSLDWDALVELDDNVEGVQNLACSSGFCEI